MQIRKKFLPFSLAAFILLPAALYAQISDDVHALQTRWAEINYQLSGDEQVDAFEALAAKADEVTSSYPDSAEAWIWSGIIKSTFAGAKGGLGALSLAKASRKDLERAMDINPAAMNGSAYTSLGTLYYSVPGWPIGFGDDDLAEELLSRALTIAPNDIDANYFYAEFKRDQKEYDKAQKHYLLAQAAPAREGRSVADAGRQQEIENALKELQKDL